MVSPIRRRCPLRFGTADDTAPVPPDQLPGGRVYHQGTDAKDLGQSADITPGPGQGAPGETGRLFLGSEDLVVADAPDLGCGHAVARGAVLRRAVAAGPHLRRNRIPGHVWAL